MSHTNRAAALVAIAVAVAGGLAGCAHRATDEVAGALAVPQGVLRVRVELQNGTVDIAPLADGAAADNMTFLGGVRMDAADDQQLAQLVALDHGLKASLDAEDPSLLVVRGPELPDGVQGMIAYEGNIRVPAAMPLEVVISSNGHVTLVGRQASTVVRTRRGDLRFDGCSGDVKATTGQGNVIAYDHRGSLDVRSQGGDMQAFVVEPGPVLTLSTGKGTVQCHVPEGISCRVDARAETGRIGNDFELEVTKPSAYSAAMTGRLGDGASKVVLRTAAGHIAMRRLDPRKPL